MSVQFQWHTDGEGPEEPLRRGLPLSGRAVFLAILFALLLTLLLWRLADDRAAHAEARLTNEIQDLLDGRRAAFTAGDGERYFAYAAPDPAWWAAQLQPSEQAIVRAGLTVVKAGERDGEIWAAVRWKMGSQLFQRIAFFRRQGGPKGKSLLQVPSIANYWGEKRQRKTPWGTLVYWEADEAWSAEVSAAVSQAVSFSCADQCPLPGRVPFTLTLAADRQHPRAAGGLYLLSPRLLALDEQGAPAEPFWEELAERVRAHLTPAVVRFAISDEVVARSERVIYEELALAFSSAHPAIDVEIVALGELPGEIEDKVTLVDGVALAPDANLIAAGLVQDLTELAESDPNFDQADFYGQIWEAAWWQGRFWFVPQAAAFPLMFYNKRAYDESGLSYPHPGWSWEKLERDVTILASRRESMAGTWAFLDEERITLFGRALSEDCQGEGPIGCGSTLSPAAVASALNFYASLAGRPGHMPDLTLLSPERRRFQALNMLRRSALWVEYPVYYESYVLGRSLGMIAFPGTTPLEVEGSFISSFSDRPLATWEWLNFLSRQHVRRQLRHVPARPSVANANSYWRQLPRPLADVMWSAFPDARAISIADRLRFPWEQLAALTAGRATPDAIAQGRPAIRWFLPESIIKEAIR